jgi:hypothetical protein
MKWGPIIDPPPWGGQLLTASDHVTSGTLITPDDHPFRDLRGSQRHPVEPAIDEWHVLVEITIKPLYGDEKC